MDFINYVNDNDHIIYAALCHVFSRQIEKAVTKLRDDEATFTTTCAEAPHTKLRLYIPHMRKAEIEFMVTIGGRRFDLCGVVENLVDSNDTPCLSLHGLDYHYRPEHSRLPQRGVDGPRFKENRAMCAWWDHVQQSEIISRLQVI